MVRNTPANGVTPKGTKNGRKGATHTQKKGAPQNGSGTTPGPHTPGRSGERLEEGAVVVEEFRFTARTCLELLANLSEDQINHEIQMLDALERPTLSELNEAAKTRSQLNSKPAKLNRLRAHLNKTLKTEVDTIVKNLDLLAESIHQVAETTHHLVESAQELTAGVQSTDVDSHLKLENGFLVHSSRMTSPAQPDPHQKQTHGDNPGEVPVDEPVKFLSVNFANIVYEDVEAAFDFSDTLPGQRSCVYYGKHGYSYGKITHEPAPYPSQHPVLDVIFDKLSDCDPSFTRDNYSCLVQLYPDGKSNVAMHSDDEHAISKDSNIYTVSFGAERTARFYNVVGALRDEQLKLTHGSVHVMSHSSQSVWKHGIMYEPAQKNGRISLTFRHMAEPSAQPVAHPAPIPPVAEPVKPVRVLLLTDSVHSNTPTHIFEAIPNHVCIKKTEFQLTNLEKYCSEFAYTDVAIISMGVNDLSRYNHTSRSLAATVGPLLQHYSRRFPHCQFVFNSLLLTRDIKWLNREIDHFNQFMFDFSRDLKNVSFFDSDRLAMKICKEGRLSKRDVYSDGNGIHVTVQMRRPITAELVRCVRYLSGSGGPGNCRCDWLRNASVA